MSMVQRGIISEIHPDHYIVTVIRHSACSACATQGACAESEQKAMQVRATRFAGSKFEKGECVDMHMGSSRLISATLLAYILPLCFMLAALFISGAAIHPISDGVRSIWAFSGLALGFGVLRLLQPVLRRHGKFEITLSKAEEQSQSTF